jgi:flagellar hook assembly protein FlgD
MGLENRTPGLNQVYWDTRDELGNRIGNGIYIYKIEAECEGLSKEEASNISKLMILR